MDGEPDSHFPGLLRHLRTERGLSQEQLAAKVGVSDASISYWETGKYAASFGNVRALAKFLEAPELLAAAGFDEDEEFESMRAELQRQGRELDELKQMLADLFRRLPDA